MKEYWEQFIACTFAFKYPGNVSSSWSTSCNCRVTLVAKANIVHGWGKKDEIIKMKNGTYVSLVSYDAGIPQRLTTVMMTTVQSFLVMTSGILTSVAFILVATCYECNPYRVSNTMPIYNYGTHFRSTFRFREIVLLSFFFWPLCCLSFNLRIVITPFGIFKLFPRACLRKGP